MLRPPASADRPPGAGRLPLLLLPGTLCDGRLFAPVLRRLPRQPALVADMGGADSAAGLAERILDGAPRRFALGGFSLGGIVALEMIARAPERVARLALIDTTARPDPAANAAPRRAALERARTEGMASYVLDAWPRLVAPAHRDRADLRDLLVAMARDGGADVLAAQTEVAITRADSRPRLHDIRVPTLVLAGAQEAVCPLDAHREIADAVPGAAYHLIDGAGHFAPLEDAEAVAAHLGAWLRDGREEL